MNLVGVFSMILGALSCLAIINGDPSGLINGGVMIFIGLWTTRAAKSFRAIVDTEGADLTHLMTGIEGLKKLYTFQKYILIMAVIGAVALGAMLALGTIAT